MLALVWAVYASFGMTVGSIPPLVEPIVEDLGISYSGMGLILGSWQLVYIVTALPMGMLVDRLGTRKALGLGVLVVWLSLVLRGFAGDFVTLLLAVALLGVGGPLISIGAPKVVSQWFEGKERSLAAGIYAAAPVAGGVLSLATASSVVLSLTGTWRGIALVYGAIVLLAMAAWWLFAKDAPRVTKAAGGVQRGESGSALEGLKTLLRIRNVQLLLALAIATFFLNHGLEAWVPTLLKERGMTLAAAGFWTAFAAALGAVGALVVSGVATHGRRVVVMVVLLVVASSAIAAMAFADSPVILAPLLVSSWVRQPMMPVLSLVLMETPGVGAARIGAAMGLFFAAAEIGGFGAPVLVGLLRDATGSLTWGVLSLAIMGAALLIAMPFVKETKAREGGGGIG
jgi:nitrate/nitrite transporter NarK